MEKDPSDRSQPRNRKRLVSEPNTVYPRSDVAVKRKQGLIMMEGMEGLEDDAFADCWLSSSKQGMKDG